MYSGDCIWTAAFIYCVFLCREDVYTNACLHHTDTSVLTMSNIWLYNRDLLDLTDHEEMLD